VGFVLCVLSVKFRFIAHFLFQDLRSNTACFGLLGTDELFLLLRERSTISRHTYDPPNGAAELTRRGCLCDGASYKLGRPAAPGVPARKCSTRSAVYEVEGTGTICDRHRTKSVTGKPQRRDRPRDPWASYCGSSTTGSCAPINFSYEKSMRTCYVCSETARPVTLVNTRMSPSAGSGRCNEDLLKAGCLAAKRSGTSRERPDAENRIACWPPEPTAVDTPA